MKQRWQLEELSLAQGGTIFNMKMNYDNNDFNIMN